MSDSLQHWATLPADKLVGKIQEKFEDFENALLSRDLDRMQLATYAYYGCDEDGNETARIGKKGEQGQIRYLMDNEYRTALRNKLTIATAEPPGFTPVPSNSDSDMQAATVLARAVLDYYFDELGGYKFLFRAAEASENLGWAWVDVPWNERAGPVAKTQPARDPNAPAVEGQPAALVPQQVRAGDAEFRFYLPTDVAFEYDARGDQQWLILRRWVNKFDLAAEARTPEDAAKLQAMSGVMREDRVSRFIRGWAQAQGSSSLPRSNPDEVVVLELRHKKTPGCPDGRWCRVVGDVVLADGPARYVDSQGQDDLACYRIAAGERYGTPRAYTSAHDSLGLQRAVDTLTSIPYSNQAAQGLNVILNPEGNDLRPEDLRKGLLALNYKGGEEAKPSTLELSHTDPQIFENRKEMKGAVGEKMGMDDQAMGRGALPSSGSLAALLDDKTQRSVSGLTKAVNELAREMATGLLRRFQQFGEHSRTLPLTLGKTKRAVMGSFGKAELGGIDRVKVETIPTAMRTLSGRYQTGKLLIDAKAKGLDVQALITLIETGKWESLIEDEFSEQLTIREENERLLGGEALEPVDMNGQPLPQEIDEATGQPKVLTSTALFTDHPIKHLLGHRPTLASPAARKNAAVVGNVGAHMMAHVQIALRWMQGDPLLVMLHGPPPQMPMAPAGPPGARPGPGAPAGGGAPPGLPPGPDAGNLPSPPTNPSSGEKWSPSGEVNPNG